MDRRSASALAAKIMKNPDASRAAKSAAATVLTQQKHIQTADERIADLEAMLREWVEFGLRISGKPLDKFSEGSLVARTAKLLKPK